MTTDALKSFVLSADDLRSTTDWPESVIEDYLNLVKNFQILATIFQVLKNGTQITTATYQTLTGWTEDKNQAGFIFESSSGEIDLPENGQYELSAWVQGDAVSQLDIKAQIYNGSTWNDLTAALDSGTLSAQINGYVFEGSVGQKIRLMVKHTGSSVTINSNMARISLGRKG